MTYQEAITSKEVVLVEFFATWCPHCQRMMPVVAQVKELLDGRAAVEQYDVDKNKELADEVGVTGLPTFILYKGGQEVWRHAGEIDGEVLYGEVEKMLK